MTKPWDETYYLDAAGDVRTRSDAIAVVLAENDPDLRRARGKMFVKAPELVRTLLALGVMRRVGAINEWHLRSCDRAGMKDDCDHACLLARDVLVQVGAL